MRGNTHTVLGAPHNCYTTVPEQRVCCWCWALWPALQKTPSRASVPSFGRTGRTEDHHLLPRTAALQHKPTVMCNLSAKPTYVGKHIITHRIFFFTRNHCSLKTQTVLEQEEFGRKWGFETRSKQSSKQSMPAFWHSAEEINGKLDGIWEMCVFAIDSPLWCFLSAWNEWEVVEC